MTLASLYGWHARRRNFVVICGRWGSRSHGSHPIKAKIWMNSLIEFNLKFKGWFLNANIIGSYLILFFKKIGLLIHVV